MSAVELAIEKVRHLSPKEARELLKWMNSRQLRQPPDRPKLAASRRRRKVPVTKERLKAWHDSLRLPDDWEPPRMPYEEVKHIDL